MWYSLSVCPVLDSKAQIWIPKIHLEYCPTLCWLGCCNRGFLGTDNSVLSISVLSIQTASSPPWSQAYSGFVQVSCDGRRYNQQALCGRLSPRSVASVSFVVSLSTGFPRFQLSSSSIAKHPLGAACISVRLALYHSWVWVFDFTSLVTSAAAFEWWLTTVSRIVAPFLTGCLNPVWQLCLFRRG